MVRPIISAVAAMDSTAVIQRLTLRVTVTLSFGSPRGRGSLLVRGRGGTGSVAATTSLAPRPCGGMQTLGRAGVAGGSPGRSHRAD
jgi:hypothetical protein